MLTIREYTRLTDIDHSREDLVAMARQLGMTNVSTWSRSELAHEVGVPRGARRYRDYVYLHDDMHPVVVQSITSYLVVRRVDRHQTSLLRALAASSRFIFREVMGWPVFLPRRYLRQGVNLALANMEYGRDFEMPLSIGEYGMAAPTA